MPRFDIQEIATTAKTHEENETALEYFREVAFASVPADEIISILKQNIYLWQSVWVREGKGADTFQYPEKILREAKDQKENILSLIITGSSASIVFMYDLKEYADDFSFTSAFALPDEKTIFMLFFVKK